MQKNNLPENQHDTKMRLTKKIDKDYVFLLKENNDHEKSEVISCLKFIGVG